MINGVHHVDWDGFYARQHGRELFGILEDTLPLRFNGAWRFQPPTDGIYRNQNVPPEAVEDFWQLIVRTATQGDRQEVFEHFKRYFCGAVGTTHVRSTSAGWAETDLRNYMYQAAENLPLFIEAFFDACQALLNSQPQIYAPEPDRINSVLSDHNIGYVIRAPDLVFRETVGPATAVPDPPATLAEQAVGILRNSLARSDQLLSEGHYREAVQEILWLLETVTTAFRGIDTTTGTVEGNYFNRIVRDLRRLNPGTTLDRALGWMAALHGYLSSPTGGGVRHGTDLNAGVPIDPHEARLFCNLIRSYIPYLLSEHERLVRAGRG